MAWPNSYAYDVLYADGYGKYDTPILILCTSNLATCLFRFRVGLSMHSAHMAQVKRFHPYDLTHM